MPWSHPEVRRLLSLFPHPRRLEEEPLAVLLRNAMRAKSAQEALAATVQKAVGGQTQHNELLRNVIVRGDFEGRKSASAAASLGLSVRSYFRYRGNAVKAIATTIERELRAKPEETNYQVQLAEMVARFEPKVAFDFMIRAVDRPNDQLAYEMICLAIDAGRRVPKRMLERCRGPWRALALTALRRRRIIEGRPERARRWRAEISRMLRQPATPADHRAAFEMAYSDRLEAIRRGDMAAARSAAERMAWHGRSNPSLSAFAMAVEVEQAYDDGDESRASAVLSRLRKLNAASYDFKVMARTAHVQATLALTQGRWEQAADLARLASIALTEVEPGFAISSHAIAGRAALQLQNPWSAPLSLCARFPDSWITVQVYALQSRHELSVDPIAARTSAERSVAIARSQQAPGPLSYAQASLAFALDRLGETKKAAALRIESWESAVRIGRRSYLYDMFVHPHMNVSDLGSFELSESFFMAVMRRARELCIDSFGHKSAAVLSALEDAIRSALTDNGERGYTGSRNGGLANGLKIAECLAPHLARDLSYCLHFSHRENFVKRFTSALLESSVGSKHVEGRLSAAS